MVRINLRNYRWRFALIALIPSVALLVAARQFYLSRYHDLTTWKGGGMGMFAGADFTWNRYARIFIIDSSGQREPLSDLAPDQADLVRRALNYPVRHNFLLAAKAIAKRQWIPRGERRPVTLLDATGKRVGTAAESYYWLGSFGLRPREEKWQWDLQIEYWKLSYNPATGRAHSVLAETFFFKPEDLQSHDRS